VTRCLPGNTDSKDEHHRSFTRRDRVLDAGQASLANTGWNIRPSRSLSTVEFSSASNHQSFSSNIILIPFAPPHTFFPINNKPLSNRQQTTTNQQHAILHPFHISLRMRSCIACASSWGKSRLRSRSARGPALTLQQTGLGDVESGAAQGTNTLLSGGANNAVSSTGNSVADVSNSAGNLINRSPEAQVGVSALRSCQFQDSKTSDTITTDRPRRR
jgi:hypothetical protein